jgi:predicted small secreted protein
MMKRALRLLPALFLAAAGTAACGTAAHDRDDGAGEDPAMAGEPGAGGDTAAAVIAVTDTAAADTGTPARPPAATRPDPATPATPAPDTLTGQLAITGADPLTFVTLQPEGRRAVQLTGGYESELRNLAGAVVRVQGRPTAGPLPGPALEVSAYDIVSIDGQRPRVGVLQAAGGEYRLAGAEPVRLVGVPPELGRHAGAKIWVVGVRDGDALRLHSYGIIRP